MCHPTIFSARARGSLSATMYSPRTPRYEPLCTLRRTSPPARRLRRRARRPPRTMVSSLPGSGVPFEAPFPERGVGQIDQICMITVPVRRSGCRTLPSDQRSGLAGGNGKTANSSTADYLERRKPEACTPLPFPRIFSLWGSTAPIRRISNARLGYHAEPLEIAADSIDRVGVTRSYTLDSFVHPLDFSGRDSSTPVDANGVPGFEVLKIQVGLSQESAGKCLGSADLYARLQATRFNSEATASTRSTLASADIKSAGLASSTAPTLCATSG